jgi:two-component system invasion response regulator UvrY
MPLYDTLKNVVWIDRNQLLVELLPLQRLAEYGISIRRTISHCDHLSELVRNEQPDVCVMCSSTYRALVSEISTVLAFKTERCRLAVFADELTDNQIDQALSLGVKGFLSKTESLPSLASAIRQVAEGTAVVSNQLVHRISSENGRHQVKTQTELTRLSQSQLRLLQLLAQGESTRQAAAMTGLTVRAVESHKYRLFKRLGVQNRVELCRWALRVGLIDTEKAA